MRNLLAFLAAVVLGFLVLGWYLDWYKVNTLTSQPGHRGYSIDIDSKKIGSDVSKYVQQGEEKVQELIERRHAEEAAGAPPKNSSVAPLRTSPRGVVLDEQEEAEPRRNDRP